MTAVDRTGRILYAILFLSGAAGLGYEVVWTRMFSVGLGHEIAGVLAVVAAFFGGLALGAWGLDRRVSASRRPGRWYVRLELFIALWALVSLVSIPWLNVLAARLIGVEPSPLRHWLVAFGIPFVGLLPATAAMGATLPAMERLVARLRGSGRTVGGLYSANTAGAVAGTIVTTFLLAPAFGHRVASAALISINVLCAILVARGPAAGESERAPVEHAFDDPPRVGRLLATLFVTGLLGIGYEVLGIRVIGQILENTVYTFAAALAVYLAGTAAGAALYQRFAPARRFAPVLEALLLALPLTMFAGVAVLRVSGPMYESVRLRLGGGTAGSIGAELALAAAVFLGPTLVMGALFSHLAQAARRAGGGIGRALGVNTIGASLAPLLFGVLLLPALGAKWVIVACGLAYLVLLPRLPLRRGAIAAIVASGCVLAILPADLVLVEPPPDARIIDYREGVMASVAVTENPQGQRLLKVNNRFSMGGMVHSFADRRQAHVLLLLHPAPRSALFLGVGSGITAGAAVEHDLELLRAVELVPEVVDVLPLFSPANAHDRLDRSVWVVADARRYVRATDETFDVIIADLFHPARDGAGALYTREHYEAIRERLAPGGIACQWLPLYQLDGATARLIVRTFLSVFPDVDAYMAHFNVQTPMLGLVGGDESRSIAAPWMETRVASDGLRDALHELAIDDDLDLLGGFLADRAALETYAGAGPINTDDHPRVIYQAPRFAYSQDARNGWGRLREFLEEYASPGRDALGGAAAAGAFADRLDAYVAARNAFLLAQIAFADGDAAAGLDGMLEAVRRSDDFTTAYIVALNSARTYAGHEPEAARRLLRGLREARPEDPRAARVLRQLFGE